jgi:hypothetical protein
MHSTTFTLLWWSINSADTTTPFNWQPRTLEEKLLIFGELRTRLAEIDNARIRRAALQRFNEIPDLE